MDGEHLGEISSIVPIAEIEKLRLRGVNHLPKEQAG